MANIKKKLTKESNKKKLIFSPNGWEDFQYWRANDLKKFEKLNQLIEASLESPYSGIGKPEKLSGDLKGFYSRRIDQKNRLVYKFEDETLFIVMARFHY